LSPVPIGIEQRRSCRKQTGTTQRIADTDRVGYRVYGEIIIVAIIDERSMRWTRNANITEEGVDVDARLLSQKPHLFALFWFFTFNFYKATVVNEPEVGQVREVGP